jgi:hypothetical protein
LFDVSCLFGTPEFATIQTDAFEAWDSCPDSGTNPLSAAMAQQIQDRFNLTVDGQHYFVNQSNGLEAVWDLTSSGPFKGNSNAIVFAHKVKTANSPDGSDNVAWVELKKDSGGLANTVYRTNTVKGQPPPSVSSSVDWCLSRSINVILFSVPPELRQVSSMPQNTVCLHDMVISAWPSLTCDVSSASLKRLALR